MTQQVFEKTMLSSMGYGFVTGISFGMRYHSFLVGFLAMLICAGIYAGIMIWRLNSV